jgi:hypothetical protein
MFKQAPFYNESLKSLTAAFGTLFNDIQITRSGVRGGTINVPLSYASRDKAWIRRTQDDDLNFNMRMQFPRLAFFMTNLTYDPARKINQMQTVSDGVPGNRTFHPVPYDVDFELYVATAHLEDGLQIIEQILPYFAPEYTISVKQFPTLTFIKDVQIKLNSITPADNTPDSEFEDVRVMEWTLSFTAKAWIGGPTNTTGKSIKDIKMFFFDSDIEAVDPTQTVEVAVNPLTANAGDAHTITTTIT